MAEGVKHDYHLVNPSPWPLTGSIAATVLTLGLVVWMKGLFGLPKGTSWVFFAGLAGILYTMFGWWRDVVKEANAGDHTPVVSIGLRYGMILFIASEVMFFVAWFWIFFEMALFHGHRTISSIEEVRAAWATWPPKGVEAVPAWNLPLVNTLVLLLSGTTVTWAHHALLENDRKGLKYGLILTIVLGATFTCVQAYEYSHAAFSFAGNIYGATASTPRGGQVAQAARTSSMASPAPERWPWNRAISKKIQNQATKNITSEAMNRIMP